MCGWGGYGMGWGMGWGMLGMWLVMALVVGGIWAWSRSARGSWGSRDAAERVLRERFARGEIDGETFRQMVAQLAHGDARSAHAK